MSKHMLEMLWFIQCYMCQHMQFAHQPIAAVSNVFSAAGAAVSSMPNFK